MKSLLGSTNMDFTPFDSDLSDTVAYQIEASIVHTILSGTGGEEGLEMTDEGLRFVRHLLIISKPARHGFLPNFKDMNTVRKVARDFINRCGGASRALQTMHHIVADNQT